MSVRRASLILAFAAAFAAPAVAADPVFGSWTLDAARSSGGERCAVTSLEDLGNDKFRVTSVRVTADGVVAQQDGVFAFDGSDHPAGWTDRASGTEAFTRIDEHRYAVVTKAGGQATAVRSIIDDGATMVEIADGVADDEPFHASRVFTRGAGACTAQN